MYYYAVAKGHNVGIYNFWNDAKEQILGYNGAIHKRFSTEKEAEDFILSVNTTTSDIHSNIYNKYQDDEVDYFVYTDGSCYNNGKDNAISGIGIYFSIDDKRNISQIITDKNIKHTNNSAELLAIIKCYEIIQEDLKDKKICIVTDSEYSIKCATSYGEKMANENWKKNIPNKDLVEKIYKLNSNDNLKLKHVKAHTNNNDKHSLGNLYADNLAYQAIKNYIK